MVFERGWRQWLAAEFWHRAARRAASVYRRKGTDRLENPAQTRVQVKYNEAESNVSLIPLSTAAPGIFLSDYSKQQAAAINADGTRNSTSNPAARGTVVALFATGGGPTNPPATDGATWQRSPLAHLAAPVLVKIDGIDAEVVYAGSAPGMVSGIFQVNVRVPMTVHPGILDIMVSVDGIPSLQGAAFVSVK